MTQPAASVSIGADQNHLAWDPAIEPVATVGSGDVVEFDCLDASNGQITADSTTATLATLDFASVDQVTGPVEVEGAEPGDTLQVDLLEFDAGGLGLDGLDPRLRADGGRLPGRPPQDHAPRPETGTGRVLAGHSAAARAVLRGARSGARDGAALDHPARPARRQHGHPPPRRRLDALPARLPRGSAVLDRRWACNAGRRRGLGDGHRDADAGARPPQRAQGPAPHRARVPGRTRPACRAAQRGPVRHRRHRPGPDGRRAGRARA